jgi:hypothetical protein
MVRITSQQVVTCMCSDIRSAVPNQYLGEEMFTRAYVKAYVLADGFCVAPQKAQATFAWNINLPDEDKIYIKMDRFFSRLDRHLADNLDYDWKPRFGREDQELYVWERPLEAFVIGSIKRWGNIFYRDRVRKFYSVRKGSWEKQWNRIRKETDWERVNAVLQKQLALALEKSGLAPLDLRRQLRMVSLRSSIRYDGGILGDTFNRGQDTRSKLMDRYPASAGPSLALEKRADGGNVQVVQLEGLRWTINLEPLNDAKKIAELRREIWKLEEHYRLMGLSSDETVSMVTTGEFKSDNHRFIYAEDGQGKLVGYALTGEMVLINLIVHKDNRQQGVGSLILLDWLLRLNRGGYSFAWLVDRLDAPQRDFYVGANEGIKTIAEGLTIIEVTGLSLRRFEYYWRNMSIRGQYVTADGGTSGDNFNRGSERPIREDGLVSAFALPSLRWAFRGVSYRKSSEPKDSGDKKDGKKENSDDGDGLGKIFAGMNPLGPELGGIASQVNAGGAACYA